ncbi:VOC family protein [Lacibacterium aquatile]|uniref:VOC family protein n=1 Tax=Lacibacterium aquatile TaxID=1168082 RepID=A0ABW5DW19_9PROT
MIQPRVAFIILFVSDVARSVAFYRDLLGREPVEESRTFAMMPLDGEQMLGLWLKTELGDVPPAGASEIAFIEGDVDGVARDWSGKGVTILQQPTDMDFGRTFLAADPDGHRLRVFLPGA